MEVNHGFQYVHSFEKHQNAGIKQVVYNKHTKKYVSLDQKGMRMWDMNREQKIVKFKKDNFIQALVYLETRQVYLAAALDMSIKVYNHNLEKVRLSSTQPDISIEERAITSMVYDYNTETLVTGSVTGCHIWNFRGSRYKRAGKTAQYALDWLDRFPGSDNKWIHRVDFGPVTQNPIEPNCESRRIHCSYDNNILVYDLSKNIKSRCIYHTLTKRLKAGDRVEAKMGSGVGYVPGTVVSVTNVISSAAVGQLLETYEIEFSAATCAENGRSGPVRKKNMPAKDIKGGRDETLEDLMQTYGFSESQFRTWNDMITGKPILNNSYVVSFTPHKIEKLSDLRGLHNHSITGVVRNEMLGYLVTSALDLEIKVWNIANDYSVVKVLDGHARPVSALVPHPTPGLVISGGMDCTIRVWSLHTLKEEYVMETQAPVANCGYAFVQPAQNNLPVGHLVTVIGPTIVIWNHHTLTNLFAVVRSPPVLIRPTGDAGDRVFVCCHDCSARVLKGSNGDVCNTLLPDDAATLMRRVIYSETLHRYFGLLQSGQIFVYSSKTPTASLAGRWAEDVLRHGDFPTSICLTSSVKVLNRTRREYHGPVNHHEREGMGSPVAAPVKAVAAPTEYAPSSGGESPEFIVAGTSRGYLMVWDASGDGEMFTNFPIHKDEVTDVHFQRSLKLVVCFVKNELLLLVDIRTEQCVRTASLTEAETVPRAISCIQMSAKQPLMFLGLSTGSFDLLDLATGARPAKAGGFQHKKAILVASFLDRFQLLATGGMDCIIKVWESSTMQLLTEIPFPNPVRALSFFRLRGDLLVGDRNDISMIRSTAYHLPKLLLNLKRGASETDDGPRPSDAPAPAAQPTEAERKDKIIEEDIAMWQKILSPAAFSKKITKTGRIRNRARASPAGVVCEEGLDVFDSAVLTGADDFFSKETLPDAAAPLERAPKSRANALGTIVRKKKKKTKPRKFRMPPPPDYPRPPSFHPPPSHGSRPAHPGRVMMNLQQQYNMLQSANGEDPLHAGGLTVRSCAYGRTPTPSNNRPNPTESMSERLARMVDEKHKGANDEEKVERLKIIHIDMESASRSVQIETKFRRAKRKSRKKVGSRTNSVTGLPRVYQLPPSKAPFVPTAEPWTTIS